MQFLPTRTLWGRCVGLAAVLALFAGCASFKPAPESYRPYADRIEIQTNGLVRASMAVLGKKESKEMFDLPMAKKNVQPVWLRFENSGTNEYYFLPVGLDRDYYSANEVAYKSRKWLAPKTNKRMNAYLSSRQIKLRIGPESESEGYVFTTLDPGAKYVNLDLFGEEGAMRFGFTASVPDSKYDFQGVDWEALYADETIEDYRRGELRAVLEGLPAATTDAKAKGTGDPVNLAVIAGDGELGTAFIRNRWDLTESVRPGVAFKTVLAFVFGGRYRTSPVSSLYLFGRPQDLALQKSRETIHERNHLRLWLAPFTCEGRRVWVGQISRDIGLRFTCKAPFCVTHKIDPDVDEARNYLFQEMLISGALDAFGGANGVGVLTPENPGRNLTGDPYFTDGRRLVMFFSSELKSPEKVEILDWARASR